MSCWELICWIPVLVREYKYFLLQRVETVFKMDPDEIARSGRKVFVGNITEVSAEIYFLSHHSHFSRCVAGFCFQFHMLWLVWCFIDDPWHLNDQNIDRNNFKKLKCINKYISFFLFFFLCSVSGSYYSLLVGPSGSVITCMVRIRTLVIFNRFQD